MLAVVAGEAPAELFEVAPVRAGRPEPVLPPSREVYADRAGVMLQDEADAAWEQAVAAGEAGPEDEPDPRVALWREAAAGEWDGWRRRAEGAVDAVLGGEGVPPMEFKSIGGGFSCSGQCKACQPERRREPDAGCDVMMGEGRRGASPPLRYRVGLPCFWPRFWSCFRDFRGLLVVGVVGKDGQFDFA